MLRALARKGNAGRASVALALVPVLGLIVSRGLAEGLPREKLTALKRATVYVKVKDGPRIYTGSGFVFEKLEDQGYIISNAHVVAPTNGRVLPVEVVVNSGMADELVLPAKVLAKDESRDLAMLSVRSKDLPAPIASHQMLDLYETMPVFIFGFPFGEVLGSARRHPEITISKGGVSSLRNDEFGKLAAVQIDGSVNPGNSGGPIVTAEGDLVGVAVAKIAGTQIGLAIPAAELREMLLGRIGGVKLTQKTAADGKAEFDVAIDLIDPLDRIKAVTLLTIPTEALKDRPQPDEEGRFSQASPDMQPHEFTVTSQSAKGKLELSLGESGTSQKSYQFQISFVRSDKRTLHTAPAELLVKSSIRNRLSSNPRRPSLQSLPATGEVTSAATRVAPVEHKPRLAFPTPEKASAELAWEEVAGAERVKVTKLPVQATPNDDHTRRYSTAVWSSDGKSLFVVSADNRLLRFKVEEGVALQTSLAIDANCPDLTISKEGLVVALTSAGLIWVVEPETLTVLREIPVEGVRLVASSPASSVACAVGKAGLHVVDLNKGQVVHSIETGRIPQNGYVTSMRMSPDGKSLYFGRQEVVRLEVAGDELKFGEATATLQGGHTQQLCLSPDGQWMAYPTGGGNPDTGGYMTGLFDTKNLKEYAVIVDTGAYPGPLDVDPKSGQIYTTNTREIQFFSQRGGKQLVFPALSGDVRRLLASPAGGRFLVWSENHVAVYGVSRPEP